MLKRIKVVTSLIAVLMLFGAMQLLSGSLFWSALHKDKEAFALSQISTRNVAAMTDAYMALNQSRTTLNRTMLRLQTSLATQMNGGQLESLTDKAISEANKGEQFLTEFNAIPETPGADTELRDQLQHNFAAYLTGLRGMIASLKAKDLEGMFKQNIEQKQQAMQATYSTWRMKQSERGRAEPAGLYPDDVAAWHGWRTGYRCHHGLLVWAAPASYPSSATSAGGYSDHRLWRPDATHSGGRPQ